METLETLENLQVPESLEQLEAEIKPSVIQAYLETLPEKALNLGVRVLITLIFLIVGIFAIRIIRKVVRKTLEKTSVDKGVEHFVDSFLKFSLYTLLFISIAISYGIDAASVVAILGSCGIAIGLALQGAMANFAGGFLILLLKPFKVGDYIIDGTGLHEGTVKEISIFYTTLITVDNKIVVIPNGILTSSTLTNVTGHSKRMLDIEVSISYNSSIEMARKVAKGIMKENPMVYSDDPIRVFVKDLGDSAVIIGMRCWVITENYWDCKWKLLEDIKNAFDSAGIDIPYNQLDIHLNNKALEK